MPLIFKLFNIHPENLNISQLDYQIISMDRSLIIQLLIFIFDFIIIDILFLKIFIYYNYITIA